MTTKGKGSKATQKGGPVRVGHTRKRVAPKAVKARIERTKKEQKLWTNRCKRANKEISAAVGSIEDLAYEVVNKTERMKYIDKLAPRMRFDALADIARVLDEAAQALQLAVETIDEIEGELKYDVTLTID